MSSMMSALGPLYKKSVSLSIHTLRMRCMFPDPIWWGSETAPSSVLGFLHEVLCKCNRDIPHLKSREPKKELIGVYHGYLC